MVHASIFFPQEGGLLWGPTFRLSDQPGIPWFCMRVLDGFLQGGCLFSVLLQTFADQHFHDMDEMGPFSRSPTTSLQVGKNLPGMVNFHPTVLPINILELRDMPDSPILDLSATGRNRKSGNSKGCKPDSPLGREPCSNTLSLLLIRCGKLSGEHPE